MLWYNTPFELNWPSPFGYYYHCFPNGCAPYMMNENLFPQKQFEFYIIKFVLSCGGGGHHDM